jgi:flagellar protein FliO/FliZ
MATSLAPLLWLGFVALLIPVALWLLKRTPLGGAAQGAASMRCVGVLPLSPSQRIVTVEVGQGDEKRWLVLGVTGQSISTLHTLTAQPEAPQAAPAAGGFGALLAQATRKTP